MRAHHPAGRSVDDADLGDQDNAFATLKRFEEQVEKKEAAAIAFDSLAAGTATANNDLDREIAMLGMKQDSPALDDDLAALKRELAGPRA